MIHNQVEIWYSARVCAATDTGTWSLFAEAMAYPSRLPRFVRLKSVVKENFISYPKQEEPLSPLHIGPSPVSHMPTTSHAQSDWNFGAAMAQSHKPTTSNIRKSVKMRFRLFEW